MRSFAGEADLPQRHLQIKIDAGQEAASRTHTILPAPDTPI
jgi:hypothetical protein